MGTIANFTALNGHSLSLSFERHPQRMGPFTSIDRWLVNRSQFEFIAGQRELAEAHSRRLEIPFSEEYDTPNGKIAAGQGERTLEDPWYGYSLKRKVSLAAFLGDSYTLITQSPDLSPERLLDLFSNFLITELETGLKMTPHGTQATRPVGWTPSVLLEVEPLGVLLTRETEQESTKQGRGGLRRSSGGAGFCDRNKDGIPIFTLLDGLTTTTVMPNPDTFPPTDSPSRRDKENEIATWVDELVVAWHS